MPIGDAANAASSRSGVSYALSARVPTTTLNITETPFGLQTATEVFSIPSCHV